MHKEENSYSWFYSNPATHNIQTYNCLDDSTEDPGFDESVAFILEHISKNVRKFDHKNYPCHFVKQPHLGVETV